MSEWTHPRRAAKETISYLTQIEPVLDEFDERDGQRYGNDDDDIDGDDDDRDVGREQMLDNVLEEIKHQTASIMEDRKGSVVAEKIAKRLTPLQLRVVLSRCKGYMLSLANNRYSSHVLQTLLSFSGEVIEAELNSSTDPDAEVGFVIDTQGERAADDSKVDLLQDIVLSLVSELTGTWAELTADISGSHAGRAFLQVLGGLPILSEQRGKQSRHAHSIGSAVRPNSRTAGVGTQSAAGAAVGANGHVAAGKGQPPVDPEALDKWSTPHKYRIPKSFLGALADATMELTAVPAGELQGQVCGTFGCPLVVMLLRVYGNLAVEPNTGRLPCLAEDSPGMLLVAKILEWGDAERSAEVAYAMSGENTASHFLEAVLWLSPSAFFKEMYQRCFEDRLLEFCEHGVSNFLIQAALQRVDSKPLAEGMVDAISDHASALLSGGRAGVLWRAAQGCVRLNINTQTQSKLVDAIARAVQAGHTGQRSVPPPTVGSGGEEGAGDVAGRGAETSAATPSNDPFTAARVWVPALLGPRLPGEGGLNRLFLNVPGARILQNVLRFDSVVAAPVLKAVAALSENLLAAIARDNMGSRCLLDPILEAAAGGKESGKGKNKPAEDARRTILRAFRGHMVVMACDRVAWHVLLKLFRGVDMKEKRAIAEELSGGGEQASARMSGYPSGRSVMTECMVERFSRSPREWEEAFRNRDKRASMLDEILAVQTKAGGKGNSVVGEGKSKGIDKEGASSGSSSVKLAPSPFQASGASGTVDDRDGNGTERGDTGDDRGGTDGSKGGTSEGQEGGTGKEKRRRQRGRGKRGKGSGANGAVDSANDERNESDESIVRKDGEMTDGVTDPATRNTNESVSDRDVGGEGTKPKKSKKSKKPSSAGGATAIGGDQVEGAGVGEPLAVKTTNNEGTGLEIKKQKKRKRPDISEKVEGIPELTSGGGAGTDVDLSFVMEAISVSVEEDGGKRNKKIGKKRRGEKKLDDESKERNGDEEVDNDQTAESAKSNRHRKKSKRLRDEVGGELNNTGKSDENGLRKRETDGGEVENETNGVVLQGSRKSMGSKKGDDVSKTKKKKASSSGFRMF